MIAHRYSIASSCLLLGSLAAISGASCSSPAEDPEGTGGVANAAGTGPKGGSSGASSGGTAGSVATGGTGGGTTGGTGGGTPTGGTGGGTPTGGTGGGTPTGGTAGTGGMMTGGGAGTGGMMTGGNAGTGMTTGGAAGSGGSGGTGNTTTCTFNITPAEKGQIATVGIVEFSTDLAGVTSAQIDFGPDTNYGMTAPVDLAEPNYRTLLLGMKASREYHYRISATGPSGTCMSEDQTFMTGPLATGLPNVDVTTMDEAALYGGFLITGQYAQGGSGAPAYILDKDGDIVWWHLSNRDVTGVRMSWNGKHMWINSANVPESQGSNVHRVSMDGSMDENLTSQFAGQNHQMAILPDESVAFYAYGSNGCDDIKLRAPNGMVRTLMNSGTAHGAGGPCHVNAIEYSPEDETLVFSDLDNNNYTKITLADPSTVVWVLGGSTSDFSGTGVMWSRQHGIDILGLDKVVFFNNGSMGGGSGSVIIEMTLNLEAMSASRSWEYSAMPAIRNDIMGDVQRLANGNTLAAYSTQGVVHEVSASGELLQEISWPIGGAFGYVEKRKTLYGPPER